ncbi:DUF228 domain-containing protein (plasmid) [Borreliella yangtzensis]|uniref:Uncharacterized protein n=1 Tax=Borreliella yangtzensis TaxID=683292 RepID=A0ABR6PBC0_9SPIR|nr:hypothetical protein [Borreliella yangtzensis]
MDVKGKGQVPGPGVDDNLQLGLEEVQQAAAPVRARRQARSADDAQGVDSYLTSAKEFDDILLKFKKYSKSISSIENKVFSSSSGCFKSKNEFVDAYTFSCSSYTDKIEEYFYDPEKSFPYKRGVKLVPKENSLYVETSSDTDIYGICVDVCEFSCTAYVLPITNNFEGYLVTRNPSIKAGEILDINNDGVIIKAGGGPPTYINAYALSDSFTINFKSEEEIKDENRKHDYYINLVKVTIFGNRAYEKTVVAES